MRRLFTAVKSVLHGPQTEVVHFHKGPDGPPAACYDPSCPNPRLTVD